MISSDQIIAYAAVGVPALTVAWAAIRWGNRLTNAVEQHEGRLGKLEDEREQRLSRIEQIIDRRKLHLDERGSPA